MTVQEEANEYPQLISGSDLTNIEKYITPYPEALEEINRRAADTELVKQVEEYFGNDLPACFKDRPVLYLARHVASPNFETLRFLHLLEPLSHNVVISQDSHDRFVPSNSLKKALGKLSICTHIKQTEGNYSEQYQNKTIIDFATASGRPFSEIKTLWGQPLIDFHTSLFASLTKGRVQIVDDAAWIDRHGRGDLLEHYKKFLALFLVHGVLFEDYLVESRDETYFKNEILGPAFSFVEEKFGYRPLIVQLTPTSIESERFWLSYPAQALDIINKKQGVS